MPGVGVNTENEAEALDYICSMLAPLKEMADASNQKILAYFLDMALAEARQAHESARAVPR